MKWKHENVRNLLWRLVKKITQKIQYFTKDIPIYKNFANKIRIYNLHGIGEKHKYFYECGRKFGEIFENFMTETVYVCSLTHIKGWVKKKKDNSRVAPRPPENMRAHFSSLIQFLRQYRGTRGVETSFSLFFSLSLSEAMWTRSVPLYYFFSVFLLFLISVYNVCVQCTVIFGGDITFSFIFFHSTSSFRCRLSQQETKFLIRDYGAIAEWDGKKFARGERWKKFSTRWYKTMEHLTNTNEYELSLFKLFAREKGCTKEEIIPMCRVVKMGYSRKFDDGWVSKGERRFGRLISFLSFHFPPYFPLFSTKNLKW